MSRPFCPLLTPCLPALVACVAISPPATAQNWPEFYDPLVVRTLQLTLSGQDWNTVRHDQTFTIEVPAYLSMPGEAPLLVGLRRKSGAALPSEGSPDKVALKIDINEFTEQSWHQLKKLSLENGADTSPLLEGFAWYLHRLAWTSGVYPYMPGLASWVRLFVNGQDYGVFANVEQVDKRFLENRGLWLSDDTWLYKSGDQGPPTIEFGPLQHSPTHTTLCYSPFQTNGCATPPPNQVASQLDTLIDMQGMLTFGAVNAWGYSPDDLFAKGKNFYFSDSRYRERLYYPWDLDANFGSLNTNRSIYELGNSPYEDVILDNPTFRTQYDGIMRTLLNGPFKTANLTPLVNALEAALLPAMSTDPYNPVSAGDFTNLRDYISARNSNVASQLPPVVAVGENRPIVRATVSAHPNPFARETSIEFRSDRPGPVLVRVHDARGALVRTLVDGNVAAGVHRAAWAGTDDRGSKLGAGVYFVTCDAADKSGSCRVALVR
jgi:hypothetical protein